MCILTVHSQGLALVVRHQEQTRFRIVLSLMSHHKQDLASPMSTFILKYFLVKEINQLNRMIDEKIFRGEPYAQEAKTHKRLLVKLEQLQHGAQLRTFFV